MSIPKTYTEAQSFLGTEPYKVIRGIKATKVVRLSRDEIGLLYHETCVIIWNANGNVTLNSGGYRTKTTKDRMNEGSHFYIYQSKDRWFVSTLAEGFGSKDLVFEDGMTFKQKV
jgi:hypothetical protein